MARGARPGGQPAPGRPLARGHRPGQRGVASVEDVDKAVSSGPGQRWAVMGPTQLFRLGAGEGLAQFCEHYGDSFDRWWDDRGTQHLDEATAALSVVVATTHGTMDT